MPQTKTTLSCRNTLADPDIQLWEKSQETTDPDIWLGGDTTDPDIQLGGETKDPDIQLRGETTDCNKILNRKIIHSVYFTIIFQKIIYILVLRPVRHSTALT